MGRRQHELELRKDKADVELLKMQQGFSATLNVNPLPEKAEASSGNRASSEAMAVLEQRLQLAQEEAAQLRETIVKQVPVFPRLALMLSAEIPTIRDHGSLLLHAKWLI